MAPKKKGEDHELQLSRGTLPGDRLVGQLADAGWGDTTGRLTNRAPVYLPESNVFGGMRTIDPLKEYRLEGFDIGKSDIEKPRLRAGLDQIMNDFVPVMADRSVFLNLTGFASESRIQHLDTYQLGLQRARAVAGYFLDRGVRVLRIDSWMTFGAPPPTASPPEKAEARAVRIQVFIRPKSDEKRPHYPWPDAPSVPAVPNNPPGVMKTYGVINALRKAQPPTGTLPEGYVPLDEDVTKAVRKAQPYFLIWQIAQLTYDLAKQWGARNAAGTMEGARKYYAQGYAEAMADLTDGHPENYFAKYHSSPPYNVEALTRGMFEVRVAEGPGYGLLYEGWRWNGQRAAADRAWSDGRTEFTQWANQLREKLPDKNLRRQALEEDMLRVMREIDDIENARR